MSPEEDFRFNCIICVNHCPPTKTNEVLLSWGWHKWEELLPLLTENEKDRYFPSKEAKVCPKCKRELNHVIAVANKIKSLEKELMRSVVLVKKAIARSEERYPQEIKNKKDFRFRKKLIDSKYECEDESEELEEMECHADDMDVNILGDDAKNQTITENVEIKPSKSIKTINPIGTRSTIRKAKIVKVDEDVDDIFIVERVEDDDIEATDVETDDEFIEIKPPKRTKSNKNSKFKRKPVKKSFPSPTRSSNRKPKLKADPPAKPNPPETLPKQKTAASSAKRSKEFLFACQEPNCGRKYTTEKWLLAHQVKHPPSKASPSWKFICSTCNAKFPTEAALLPHMKYHKKAPLEKYRLTCPEPNCGEKFIKGFKLKRHLQQMHTPKPHICGDSSAEEKSSLTIKCCVCDKKHFKTLTQLKQHLQKEHPSADLDPASKVLSLWPSKDNQARPKGKVWWPKVDTVESTRYTTYAQHCSYVE